jgi:regulator of cell morphogenesis and NO signaling
MHSYRNIRFHYIEESDLLDFIEQRHHAYAKSMLILMLQNFKSAISSNPRHKAVLLDLKCLLEQLNAQIIRIIKLEEESLFPFVRKLIEVKQQAEPVRFLRTGLIQSSINRISSEHDHAIALIHSIKKISNHYTQPEISNELLKLCYEELREFEELAMSQILRERKFLFPRILDLESEVLKISSIAATGTSGPGHDD